MQLSKRLQTVAHLVHTGGVVADIGCDHGFTIIYLVMNQLASAGIAMDVADGPLMRAKEHIHQYELDNRIALRKSDGLQQLVEGRGRYNIDQRYRWSFDGNVFCGNFRT